MDRSDYVNLVENRYFGSVTAAELDAVCACFTADAVITILHGDNPPRIFKASPAAGEAPMRDFWAHLCANFHGRFTQFEHFIDVDAGRCAATFIVTLSPKPESAYADGGVLTLRNCNFFWIRGDRIERMTVYYANPDSAGAGAGKPTGYPPT